VITLSKILPPDVVVGLTNFADTVKRVFFQVINAVKTFAMQIGQMLSKFWKENGAEITQAVKNIGSVISTVFKFIRSEEHTSELQSRFDLVCRLLLEKKKTSDT